MKAKSWSAAGEYVVRCLVSDMKGGLAARSVVVQIGSPATYRISGQVTLNGNPLVNARLFVSSSKMAYSDSDGTYTLTGLTAGSYTMNASLYGYSFTPAGFANPVAVGPNQTGINFTATSTLVLPPTIAQQPTNQNVLAAQNAAFSVTAAGTAPLTYQWKFNATNLLFGTNATLVLTNVTMAQPGPYFVIVTNAAGAATSSIASLAVYPTAAATLTILSLSNHQPALNVSGVPGYRYSLEASINLVNWSALQTNTAPFSMVDTNASALSQRFYRARYAP